MKKQITRMFTSSTFVIFFVLALATFLSLLITFSQRSISSPFATVFTSFDQNNIIGEIDKLDYLIKNAKELIDANKGNDQAIAALNQRLLSYQFEKQVLQQALDNSIQLSSIADFNYIYQKSSIPLTNGMFNGYNYILVFSPIFVMLTSLGTNVINNLMVTYDCECGMMNVMLSNNTNHKKIFKNKFLCSLIGNSLIFIIFLTLYLSCIGAFSFDFEYVAFNYQGKALLLTTTSFIWSIVAMSLINIFIYSLISYSLSYLIRNSLLNFVCGLGFMALVNCMDTFLFNPFIYSNFNIYYYYFALKTLLIVFSIWLFVIVNKKLEKIDF